MKKLGADAAVQSDAAGNLLDIGADLFADVRDLVYERDLGREKCVGRVLDEFRCLDTRKDHRGLVQEERTIELAQYGARPSIGNAANHASGPAKILDRRTLAQEFRIRRDVKVIIGTNAADGFGNLPAGADRYRRFRDHHRVGRKGCGDFFCSLEDVGKVRMTVAAARWRANGDEYGFGAFDAFLEILGEGEPARLHIIGDNAFKTGF